MYISLYIYIYLYWTPYHELDDLLPADQQIQRDGSRCRGGGWRHVGEPWLGLLRRRSVGEAQAIGPSTESFLWPENGRFKCGNGPFRILCCFLQRALWADGSWHFRFSGDLLAATYQSQPTPLGSDLPQQCHCCAGPDWPSGIDCVWIQIRSFTTFKTWTAWIQ